MIQPCFQQTRMRHLEKSKCLHVMYAQELWEGTSGDEAVVVPSELRKPNDILKIMGKEKKMLKGGVIGFEFINNFLNHLKILK